VPCRTARSIRKHQGGDVQRPVSPEVRLTEKTREAHGWVCVYGEACRALAVIPTCTVYASASPSSALFVVALQAQGLYDAVTHLWPCEVLQPPRTQPAATAHRSTTPSLDRATPPHGQRS
jgi:hypothetical protein